jgi:heme/copper-type cytochrome/quinol oxidase subunit 1
MSGNTVLLVFAIINVVVTGLFAAVVASQYARRGRVYQLYWMIALWMAFLGTVSYVCMVLVGPTSGAGQVLFRAYYILGATFASSWLGLGSIALVAGPAQHASALRYSPC